MILRKDYSSVHALHVPLVNSGQNIILLITLFGPLSPLVEILNQKAHNNKEIIGVRCHGDSGQGYLKMSGGSKYYFVNAGLTLHVYVV